MDIFKHFEKVDYDIIDREAELIKEQIIKRKKTFLNPNSDSRFITISRDGGGSGELIVKLLPFIDREGDKHALVIPFRKHFAKIDKNGFNMVISENCPVTINEKCAICEHMIDEVPPNSRSIAQALVIADTNKDNIGKIKLLDMPNSLYKIVSEDKNYKRLFHHDTNVFLKIVISKDDDVYSYKDSYVFENDNIDIKKIVKDGEEIYYKDTQDIFYDRSNFLPYDSMYDKYIKPFTKDSIKKDLMDTIDDYKSPREVINSNLHEDIDRDSYSKNLDSIKPTNNTDAEQDVEGSDTSLDDIPPKKSVGVREVSPEFFDNI